MFASQFYKQIDGCTKKKQKTESHLDKKDQELMFPVASRIKTTSSPT